MNKEVNKVVILAGGYGTRMYPFTKVVPKELLPIGNVPCIQHVINECYYAKIREVIIVINNSKGILVDYFNRDKEKNTIYDEINSSMDIKFVLQSKKRGTAAAIYDCKDMLDNEPFGVIFPDELFLDNMSAIGQLKKSYEKVKAPIIGMKKIKKEDCHKYGIVDFDKDFTLKKIIEKPAKNEIISQYINCGRMILNSDIFALFDKLQPVNNEYFLPHLINKMISKKIICEVIDGNRYDTGNVNDYFKAVVDFAYNLPELNQYIKSKIIKNDGDI